MAEQPTCADCGTSFTVPKKVQERYPGWTPARCAGCHQRAKSGSSGSGDGGARKRGGGGRGPRRASGGRARVEENLSPDEVLERYTAGPRDGVFTDGSADPNPGPGGWGAVYVVDDEIIGERHGHEAHTTNNRMELAALLHGIELVPEGTPATVYTDSRLVVDTVTKWAAGWARNGWKRKGGPVQNLDLVKVVYERVRARPELEVTWIKAHAGARWNEYADALATEYRRNSR